MELITGSALKGISQERTLLAILERIKGNWTGIELEKPYLKIQNMVEVREEEKDSQS